MMTAEEIKAGIAYCINENFCQGCPIEYKCKADILSNARTLIEQLEEQIALMKIQMHGDCGTCLHKDAKGEPCDTCGPDHDRPAWEYEGLPEV